MNFEFSVFVKKDGLAFKVGSLCLVDTCSFPFIITRIFKGNCEEELPEKPVGRLSVNCRPTDDRQSTDS